MAAGDISVSPVSEYDSVKGKLDCELGICPPYLIIIRVGVTQNYQYSFFADAFLGTFNCTDSAAAK